MYKICPQIGGGGVVRPKLEELCNLISHKLYLFSKVGRYLTTEACILVFKTIILSLFEYGSIIYRGTSVGNLLKLNRLYFRGLRICLNANNREHKNLILQNCQISSLDD